MSLTEITKVIALDPGGTTGWAKGLIYEGRMGVISGQDTFNHIELYDFVENMRPDIIVCERFDFRKGGRTRAGVELISKEYIGVVHLYSQVMNIELHMQMPAEGVGGYWKDDHRLKEDKVFTRGKPHANDAMRHLLQWFTFKEGYKYNQKGFYRLEGNEKHLEN